jgi:diguanylate cyclase (GGDEF)-like protein
MFRIDSIRSRLLALAICATLLPTLVTWWLSYQQNRRALSEKIAESLEASSTQTAREIDLWLRERLHELRVFSGSNEVWENLQAMSQSSSEAPARRMEEYLSSLQTRIDDFVGLAVTNLEGEIVVSTGRPLTDIHLGTPDVSRNFEYLGPPFVDAESGEAAMNVAIPVHQRSMDLGALWATLTFHPIEGVLAQFAPESAEVYLVSQSNRVLASSRSHEEDFRVDSLPAVLRETSHDSVTTVDYVGYDGTEVVGTMAALRESEWAVVAEVPREAAFAEIRALRNTALLTLAILLPIVCVIAYTLGLLIVRPLRSLTDGAAQVASGNLNVDLPIIGGGEVAYLTRVFNDMVSRVRESRHSLEHRSITDGLTGLFNRRHMMESLEEEAARHRRHERPFAVLMIDVDHFKQFNDRNGHQAGDDALVRTARVIQSALREVDRAGRYGGEEFVVMLPETDRASALDVAERIRAKMASEGFGPDGAATQSLTLSVGVAEFPRDGESIEAIIAGADAALYEAKRKGRNRVVSARTPASG